jgi:hypothetical protein
MMSLATIDAMSDAAARKAARMGKQPHYIAEQAEINSYLEPDALGNATGFPFPNIGRLQSEGWTEVDRFFVDKSGGGGLNEPAMTIGQLKNALEPGYGYAIVEEGQFQLYIGKFALEAGHDPHGEADIDYGPHDDIDDSNCDMAGGCCGDGCGACDEEDECVGDFDPDPCGELEG